MNQSRFAGLVALLAIHGLAPGPVLAASWQSTVSSKVATEYDTNPSMSSSYPGGVWRALFEPGYMLTGTEGANELRARAGVQIERSSNPSLSRDRDSPNFNLGWLRQGEMNTLGVSYDYRQIALRNALVDAAGQGINGTSTSRALAGTWSNTLTERSKFSVDGSHQSVAYNGGPFINYELQTGDAKLSYELSEGNTSTVKVSSDKYMPAVGGGSSVRLNSALLDLELASENIRWTFDAGKFKDSQDNSGSLGSAEARYTGQRSQLVLNAGHLVFPGGLGGFVKADQRRVSWRYALSEDSNAGIDLEKGSYHYLDNRNIHLVAGNGIRLLNTSSTTAGVWMERELNFFWKMRTYYQHRFNKIEGGSAAYSNLVGISFDYVNPNF